MQSLCTKLVSVLLAGTLTISFAAMTSAAAPGEVSLKNAYSNYFLMGNVMEPTQTGNQTITDMFKHHYGAVTAENAMKPVYLTSSEGNYNFTNADKIITWAQNNGLQVHGHTLVWHSQSAKWLAGTPSNPLTREEAKVNLEAYINKVAGHYKGKVISWDVVNEAFLNSVSNGSDWKKVLRTADIYGYDGSAWYQAYANGADANKGESGADYIYDAFVFARLADSGAVLYYNDYNETEAGKREAIASMVEELNSLWKNDSRNKDKNRLLIEGIGMQSHYYTEQNNLLNDVEATIKRFIKTGAEISVSELDVPVGTWNTYTTRAKTVNDEQNQAKIYEDLFKLYIKYSDNIKRITLWGKADNESWRYQGDPLPFKSSYTPKAAYTSIISLVPASQDNNNVNNNNNGNNNVSVNTGGGGAVSVTNSVSGNTITVKKINASINSSKTALLSVDVKSDVSKISKNAVVKFDDSTLLKYVNDSKAVKIQITVSGAADSKIIIGKSVISKAKANGKNIVLIIKDNDNVNFAVWTVTSSDKTAVLADASLNVKTSLITADKTVNAALTKISPQNKGILLSFGANLPKSANVKIDVSALLGNNSGIKSGQTVYLYKYNSKTGKYEQTIQNKIKVNTNGTITITNAESEKYVVLTKALSSKDYTPLHNQLSSAVSKSAVKKGNTVTITNKIPQGITAVTALNKDSKTLQVKLSYSSSNASIATVNSSGKITFKSSGKVTITIKREFSNGKTTTSKLNLAVN